MINVPLPEFEDLVALALDAIPAELVEMVDNVVIEVVDLPPTGQPLLGLYQGVPLTSRGANYVAAMPDRISIYRLPILSICGSPQEIVEQVRITVVHEVAHHFGIEDDRLHALGYG
jgi:predicted Zn-dependent protease with MMP-like domain